MIPTRFSARTNKAMPSFGDKRTPSKGAITFFSLVAVKVSKPHRAVIAVEENIVDHKRIVTQSFCRLIEQQIVRVTGDRDFERRASVGGRPQQCMSEGAISELIANIGHGAGEASLIATAIAMATEPPIFSPST